MDKKLKTIIFVDDANFYYAQKAGGWRVDLSKLSAAFGKEFEVVSVNYHVAIPAKWDADYKGSINYLNNISKNKKIIIKSKPLKYIKTPAGVTKKGDVDLEIAVDVFRNLGKIDVVIIIGGDSDYLELRNFVLENKKKIIFLAFRGNIAFEIKSGKYLLLDDFKENLEFGKKITPEFDLGRLLLGLLYAKS
jgi:uncharacterized LabA/DUF88 family protein